MMEARMNTIKTKCVGLFICCAFLMSDMGVNFFKKNQEYLKANICFIIYEMLYQKVFILTSLAHC